MHRRILLVVAILAVVLLLGGGAAYCQTQDVEMWTEDGAVFMLNNGPLPVTGILAIRGLDGTMFTEEQLTIPAGAVRRRAHPGLGNATFDPNLCPGPAFTP